MRNLGKTWKVFVRISVFTFFLISISNISKAQNCTLNANIDQSICSNVTLTLTGTASGFVVGSTTWSQVSGPSVVITSPNALITTVTGISGGNVYRFRLSANCSDGSLVFDDVLITVRPTPVANAGLDRTFCPASPAGALAANAPAVGETGVWSGNANGITVVTPTSPTSNINVVGTSSGVANLTWTLTNTSSGCTSSDIVVITNLGGVSPVSAGPDILATAIACYGTTTSATMAGSQNGTNTGTWTAISGPNTPVITTPSSRTTTVTNLIQGTYTFRWTVSGPCVNGYDEMQVFVPVATATLTTLSGSSTQTFCDNRTSVVLSATAPQYTGETVLWTYVSGPAGSVITSPTSPTTTITGLNGTAGSTYVYRYTITNTFSCIANVTRTIAFVAPPASISITGGTQVLGCNATTASVSYTVSGGNQTQWRLLSGPAPGTYPSAWNNVASSPASITGLNNIGTYVVQLQRIVSGATNTCPPVTATVNVATSQTPTAINAGTKQVLACNIFSTTLAGNTISTGTGTWSQVSGPNTANIVSVNSPTSAVNGLINGLYKFRWLSNGGPGCATNQGDASVAVSNVAPSTSVAGSPQTVCFNTPVQLAANTPVLNETGTWTVSPSTGVTISNINKPNAIVTLPNPGTAYTFTWTIVNGCGTSSSNVVITTLSSQGPVASNAGPDQCQPAGTTTFTLAGNNPSPGNGLWTKITGGAATITTPSALGTTVTGMSNGIYTFEWAISTGGCAVSRDTMMVTISAPVTTANAGADQQICTSSATFAANTPSIGTGSWSEVSAPAGYTITNPNSPTSAITGLVEGVYTFRWTISNGSCTPSTDDVVLYVSTPPTTANAGPDQSLCGTTSATLAGITPTNGTGTWSLVSGPNVPTFTTGTSPTTTVTGLIQGSYILRWTITAGAYCSSSSDDVNITVVPLANAGANLTPCGVTSTTLTGNAGSTGTWTQVGSTPNIATITTTGPNTSIASGLITGDYTFRYTIAAAGSCPATTSDILCTVSGQGTDANAGPDQDVCRTAASITVTLAGNTPIVGTGTWTKLSGPTGGTTFSPNANTPNATVSLTNAGIYVYVWTVGNGSCTIADQVRINVFLPPTTANAGSNQTQVCGNSTTMAANAPTDGTGGWTQVSGPNTASITSTIMPNTTITNLIAGTYVFRWTISNGPCATSSSTVSVTVYTPPTTANAGTDQTLCNATNANLAGNSITTGTGLWSQVGSTPNTAGITTPSSPTTGITGLIPGVYTFRWTSTNAPCTTSDDVQITIHALPTTANAGPDQSICLFAPVVLAGNTPTTGIGTWSQISGPTTVTFNSPSSPTSTVNGVVVGTYLFQWNISNGTCTTSTDQVQIVINDLPSFADAGPDQTGVATCGLTTVTLAANNPTIGIGKWTIVSGTGGSFSDGNSRTSTFTGTAGTTYILRWTISYLTCTSYTDDVVIKFNARPAITAMTTSVCSAVAFTVTPVNSTDGFVPAGTTYSWTAPSGTGFTGGTASSGSPTSISGTLTNNTNAPVTATYTITPTSGLCTGSPFTVAVTVNPKPAVTAMITTICSSETFTTTPVNSTNGIVPAGTIYSWSAPTVTGGITGGTSGSGDTSISGTLINPTNIARTATYTVTPTSGSCAGSTFTVTVTVSPKPAVNNLTATICSGGTFTTTPVNATNGIVPSGTTYSWSAPSGSGFTGGAASSGSPTSISGTLTNTTNAAVTATYTVTPTSGSCAGSTFTVTVTVSPKPAVNNLTATICSDGTFTTTPVNSTNGIIPSGTTFSWSAPAGTGFTGGAASSGTPTSISGTLTNTTNAVVTATYTVTPTSGSCAGSTFTVTVTVSPKPAVNNLTATICGGGTFTTTPVNSTNGIVPSGTTYSWSAPSGSGFTGGAASSDSPTSISGTLTNTTNAAVTATYTVTPTSGSCAGSTFTVTVTVNPKPVITVTSDVPICTGNSATLTANGGVSYTWSPSAGLSATTGPSVVASPTITTIYTVTGTNSYGCSNTATVTVTVNSLPFVFAITGNTTICNETTSQFNDATPGGVWSSSDTGIATINAAGLVSGVSPGVAIIYYTVTNGSGCATTVQTSIIYLSPVNVINNINHVTCNGGSNGAINLTVSGGAGSYTYIWGDGPTTEDRTGLSAGTYNVTVKDANNCTEVRPYTVNQPTALNVSALTTDVICSGASNGSINLSVSGGTSPYTFAWSNGATTEDLNLLSFGIYTVTVTDAVGCTAVFPVTVQNVCVTFTKTLHAVNGNTSATTFSAIGDVISYDVVVTNTGTAALTSIHVTDPLTGLNQTINSLAAGASQTITTTYTVLPADLTAATITNTSTANFSYNNAPYSYSDSEIIGAGAADLSITKTVESSPVVSGGELIYKIVVTNHGPAPARNVQITDIITAFGSPAYSTTLGGTYITWSSPYTVPQQIANGATYNIYIKGILSATQCSAITNSASVTSDNDNNPDNNGTGTITTIVLDHTTPVFTTCPADINTVVNNGCNAAALNLGTPAATDNCSAVTFTNNAPVTFPLGVTTVTWTARDASGNTSTCTQTVTVTNAAPTAVADSYNTVQSTAVGGNVLLNDTDPEGQSLTVSSWGIPLNGSLSSTTATGVFTYTPTGSYTGSDSFTYTVQDACGLTTTGTVTITIASCVAPPSLLGPIKVTK